MSEIVKILTEYKGDFLIGISVTLKMTLIIWVIGLIVGAGLGVLASKFKYAVGIPSKLLTFILGGIPVLVFLYWLHYPFQTLLGIQIDGFTTTILTLSILNVFLVAEQVRNAIEHFPEKYILSAEVCGLSPFKIITQIQAPYILRRIIPSVLLIQVVMMHSTLFGSLISVDEIFRIASRVNSEVYKPVEVFSTLAIFFLVLSLPITGLSYWLKHKFSFVK